MRLADSLAAVAAEGAVEGVVRNLDGLVNGVLDNLWSHPWFPFISGAQCRLMETGMKPRAAWELARKVLLEYVKDEGVAFGDARFDWGPQGGRDVIQDCEIDHWDATP